jgi:hypothetical protein
MLSFLAEMVKRTLRHSRDIDRLQIDRDESLPPTQRVIIGLDLGEVHSPAGNEMHGADGGAETASDPRSVER